MKRLATIFLLVSALSKNHAQNDSISTQQKAQNVGSELSVIVNRVDSLQKKLKTSMDSINEKFQKIGEKVVRFGVSIGYNSVYKDHLNKYQSASIDLKDTTLRLETMDPYSIKVSTSIIIAPLINADWLKHARATNKSELDYLRTTRSSLFKKKTDALTEIGGTTKQKRKKARSEIPRMPYRKIIFKQVKGFFLYAMQNSGITANINILEFNKAQTSMAFNKSMEGGIGFCLALHEKVFVSYSNEVYFSRQLRENIKKYANQKLYVDGKIVTSMNDLNINDDNLFITRNLIANSFKVIIIF